MLAGIPKTYSQDQPLWGKGDKIEVRSMSYEWVRATVLEVIDWRDAGRGFAYRVETEDANAPNRYWTAPANTVRTLPENNGNKNNDRVNNTDRVVNKNAGGKYKVGDRVDTYYDETRGHNRGTIIDVANGKYKVHYNGCRAKFDEWVDAALVKNPNTTSANAPEIKSLFGKMVFN